MCASGQGTINNQISGMIQITIQIRDLDYDPDRTV